ncbi:glycosyl hydrolase family 28-related protein [Paenibacillus sp. GCM10027626]|uniref:glycosyl hydrolase family 28-related protein n=1 Tax=Paenibacillus sp. GCM10027626 TaxID=3273411 RepID=UPI00363C8B8B
MSEKKRSISEQEVKKPDMTRRQLLTTIGIAGIAAASGSLFGGGVGKAFANEANPESLAGSPDNLVIKDLLDLGLCVTLTIAELRAWTKAPLNGLYYIRDAGKEGPFVYDPSDTTAADNTGTVLVSAAGARFKRIIDKDGVNIKWFGAAGDGITDDTQSIQDTIDAVAAMGGGTVFIPKGTYIVSPSGKKRIALRSNVNIVGAGHEAVVKVKDDAGDYWTIFGGFWGEEKVENVRISNFRIDQNPLKNTTCSIDPKKDNVQDYDWRQFSISLFNFENIAIDNMRFDPTCGVNTITINNTACKNVFISDCYFNFVMAKGDPDYDNSAVYMNNRSHTITNCRFYAAPGNKAIGAMETHTGQSVISNNISDGYVTGIHLQASEVSDAYCDMTIVGNTFSNANQAIQLWPRHEHPIKNVTITGNTISINNKTYNRAMQYGIGSFAGEFLPDTGAFENITVTGNTIQFQEELTKRQTLVEIYAFGIGFIRAADLRNVIISDNVIKNPPLTGIRVGNRKKIGVVSNVQITNNVIINPGHYPADAELLRTGILVMSTADGVDISGNYITDTFDALKGLYSIRLSDEDGSFSNACVRNNFITAKQGGFWLDLSKAVQTDEMEQAFRFAPAFPPASGSYEAGAILYITGADATDGPVGYKVTSAGTAGTLVGVKATGSGSAITVTNSAQLRVGQWIVLASGNQTRRIMHIAGDVVRLNESLSASVNGTSVAFAAPVFKPFGNIGKLPAIGNTNGLNVKKLEQELNLVKQALRDYGMIHG